MLSLSVLKLSMSRKKTPTRSPRRARAFERCIQRDEQLPAVGDAGERILLGQLLQLACAFLHLGFEPLLGIARRRACHGELLSHRIESHGQRVELANASTRNHARIASACQPVGGGDHAPHRTHDAEDRHEADIEEYDQHRGAYPGDERACGFRGCCRRAHGRRETFHRRLRLDRKVGGQQRRQLPRLACEIVERGDSLVLAADQRRAQWHERYHVVLHALVPIRSLRSPQRVFVDVHRLRKGLFRARRERSRCRASPTQRGVPSSRARRSSNGCCATT